MSDKIAKIVTANGTQIIEMKDLIFQAGMMGFTMTGLNNNPHNRQELQQMPMFFNLCGPMYDGVDEQGRAVIRYEDEETYRALSM